MAVSLSGVVTLPCPLGTAPVLLQEVVRVSVCGPEAMLLLPTGWISISLAGASVVGYRLLNN